MNSFTRKHFLELAAAGSLGLIITAKVIIAEAHVTEEEKWKIPESILIQSSNRQ